MSDPRPPEDPVEQSDKVRRGAGAQRQYTIVLDDGTQRPATDDEIAVFFGTPERTDVPDQEPYGR